MSAKLPEGFFAQTLKAAYPATADYFITLYPSVPTSLADTPCEVESKRLSGYRVVDHATHATLHFDRVIDWMGVSVKTRGALVHDKEKILSILDFETDAGVFNGVFSVTLNEEGVVFLGAKD